MAERINYHNFKITIEDIYNVVTNSENLELDNSWPDFSINQEKKNEWLYNLRNIKLNNNIKDEIKGDFDIHDDYLMGPDNIFYQFGKMVIDNMRYIPFEEFYGRIKLISREIYEMIINSNDHFIFYFNGEINKSNTWVFLLFMKSIFEIGLLYDHSDRLIFLNKSTLKNHLIDKDITYNILQIDDMSYSGQQFIDFLITIDMNDPELSDYNIKYYYTAPFISSNAKDLFEYNHLNFDHPEILYFYNTEVIPSFNKLFQNPIEKELIRIFLYKEDNSNRNTAKYFEYRNENFCNVYFQHKIADNESFFNKILLISPLPDIYCNIKPLINNCDVFDDKGVDCSIEFFNEGDFITDGLNIDNCKILRPYYKNDNIKYIFEYKGQRINLKDEFKYINEKNPYEKNNDTYIDDENYGIFDVMLIMKIITYYTIYKNYKDVLLKNIIDFMIRNKTHDNRLFYPDNLLNDNDFYGMFSNNYKSKYLKYKSKYLLLKKNNKL